MAKKRQYKSIDDINAAQRKMSKQCKQIERETIASITNPTGLLMDVGLGLLSNRFLGKKSAANTSGGIFNLFKNKKNKKVPNSFANNTQTLNNNRPNSFIKKFLRGGTRVFIKYQLLNVGLWLGKQAIDAIKKKRAERRLNKAAQKLDKVIATVKNK